MLVLVEQSSQPMYNSSWNTSSLAMVTAQGLSQILLEAGVQRCHLSVGMLMTVAAGFGDC